MSDRHENGEGAKLCAPSDGSEIGFIIDQCMDVTEGLILIKQFVMAHSVAVADPEFAKVFADIHAGVHAITGAMEMATAWLEQYALQHSVPVGGVQ